MPRRFQLWQKKRGDRRTGSQLVGSVGEGSLFAVLLLVGSFFLIALVTSRVTAIPGFSNLTIGSGLWLSVLVLMSFVLIGAGGLIWTVLRTGVSAERRSALARKAADADPLVRRFPSARDYPTIPINESLLDSPGVQLAYRLSSSTRHAWSLLATALFALLCNGLLAVTLVFVVKRWVEGTIPWIALLCAVPLAVAAYRVTLWFLRRLGETLRVGPTTVEVSDLPLYPGQRYEVCVVQAGRMLLPSLQVRLVCEEKATYREGTDVRVEAQRVFDQRILSCKRVEIRPGAPFSHEGEFVVPPTAMHSFQAPSNKIQWMFLVRGRLTRGRRFERQFPVVVYPDNSHEHHD